MMSHVNRELLDKAARRYEMTVRTRRALTIGKVPGRVVAISRLLGAGARNIAGLLGKSLGCQVWDREILDVMASQEFGIYQQSMFESLDESVRSEIESVLYSVAGQVGTSSYMYLLPRVIHIIAQNDAVIVGRGADLILPEALSVFIKASLENRVRNLKTIHGLPEDEARRRIDLHDRLRADFKLELARKLGMKPKDPVSATRYDLEINTDRIGFEDAAEIILLATNKRFSERERS